METFRDFLFEIFRNEWNKTSADRKSDCADWTEFYNHWIDLMKSIIAMTPSDIQSDSLVAIRFLEFNREILWALFATMVGSYESTVRELRFWLEALLQAYLADLKGGVLTLSRRLENLTGTRLIKACAFEEPYESQLRSIYKSLSKYVHPTRRELNFESVDPRVTFFYDRESFDRNRHLHGKTCDAILFIVMKSFPIAARNYAKKHLVLESLQDLGYDLSLRCIRGLLAHQ